MRVLLSHVVSSQRVLGNNAGTEPRTTGLMRSPAPLSSPFREFALYIATPLLLLVIVGRWLHKDPAKH